MSKCCNDCGSAVETPRHRFCEACAFLRFRRRRGPSATWAQFQAEREASRQRGSTEQRGYGREHRRRRAAWKRRVDAGEVLCARCHKPIIPGTKWHLDHGPDRNTYLGPSHASCNVAAANATRPRSVVKPTPNPPAPVDDNGRVIRVPHTDGGFTTPTGRWKWSMDW